MAYTSNTGFYLVGTNVKTLPNTKGCNSICFVNNGNVNAYVNSQFLIVPGAAVSFNQPHPDVKDNTDYYVTFDRVDPVTDVPLVSIATTFLTPQ